MYFFLMYSMNEHDKMVTQAIEDADAMKDPESQVKLKGIEGDEARLRQINEIWSKYHV